MSASVCMRLCRGISPNNNFTTRNSSYLSKSANNPGIRSRAAAGLELGKRSCGAGIGCGLMALGWSLSTVSSILSRLPLK